MGISFEANDVCFVFLIAVFYFVSKVVVRNSSRCVRTIVRTDAFFSINEDSEDYRYELCRHYVSADAN